MPPVIEEGVEEPYSPDVLTVRVEPSQADGARKHDTMVSVGDAPAVRYRLAGNVDELRKQLVAEQKNYRYVELVGPKAGKGEVPALSVILLVQLLQDVDFETIWLGEAPLPGG